MDLEYPFNAWKQTRRHGKLNYVITLFLIVTIGILMGLVGSAYFSANGNSVEQFFLAFPIYCLKIVSFSLTVSLVSWYLCEALYKYREKRNNL